MWRKQLGTSHSCPGRLGLVLLVSRILFTAGAGESSSEGLSRERVWSGSQRSS